MIINFECSKCANIFDYDVGSVSISEETFRPEFEKKIICNNCGALSIDEVFLTELGQSQLTEATFDLNDDELDEDSYYAECQGCDIYLPVDDQGLCSDCSEKLERDLLRERQWDYSFYSYGTDPSKREELRNKIIKKYGEKLELIKPLNKSEKIKNHRKKRKRNR